LWQVPLQQSLFCWQFSPEVLQHLPLWHTVVLLLNGLEQQPALDVQLVPGPPQHVGLPVSLKQSRPLQQAPAVHGCPLAVQVTQVPLGHTSGLQQSPLPHVQP
jgi:hypothetical protein